jgi:hypothetical protein
MRGVSDKLPVGIHRLRDTFEQAIDRGDEGPEFCWQRFRCEEMEVAFSTLVDFG